MNIANKLYVDASIKNSKRAFRAMRKKPLYMICVSEKSKHVFEVIHSFDFDFYASYNFVIVGISKTKSEAFNLLCEIYRDVINENIELSQIKKHILYA